RLCLDEFLLRIPGGSRSLQDLSPVLWRTGAGPAAWSEIRAARSAGVSQDRSGGTESCGCSTCCRQIQGEARRQPVGCRAALWHLDPLADGAEQSEGIGDLRGSDSFGE